MHSHIKLDIDFAKCQRVYTAMGGEYSHHCAIPVYLRQIHLLCFLFHTNIGLPVSVVYIQQIHLYVILSHTDVGLPVCVVYTQQILLQFFFVGYRD